MLDLRNITKETIICSSLEYNDIEHQILEGLRESKKDPKLHKEILECLHKNGIIDRYLFLKNYLKAL